MLGASFIYIMFLVLKILVSVIWREPFFLFEFSLLPSAVSKASTGWLPGNMGSSWPTACWWRGRGSSTFQCPRGKGRSWRYLTVGRGWEKGKIFCYTGCFQIGPRDAGQGEPLPWQENGGTLFRPLSFITAAARLRAWTQTLSSLVGRSWGTVLNSECEFPAVGAESLGKSLEERKVAPLGTDGT